MYIYMDLDVYTQILMYISLSCHINNDLAVLSLFNKHSFFFSCLFPEEVRPCLTKYWNYKSSIQPYGQSFCFSVF